jgi:hypothetical protein
VCNSGGGGWDRRPETDKHLPPTLYWSIFKKSRHLGFGVFIDILFMAAPLCTSSFSLCQIESFPLLVQGRAPILYRKTGRGLVILGRNIVSMICNRSGVCISSESLFVCILLNKLNQVVHIMLSFQCLI